MNKFVGLILPLLVLQGCASIPENKPEPDNMLVAGLLICQPNEQCPILAASWNPKVNDHLRVDVRLNSTYVYYDIQEVNFLVDGKRFAYRPNQPTELEYISRLDPKRSSAFITIPQSVLPQFENARRIDVLIQTDQGAIQRPMLIDGKASTAYTNFINVFHDKKS